MFDLTELPRRLLVVGGGPLGCELAQAFCRLGAETIIVQDLPLFPPKEERDAAQILSAAFARDGIEVRLNTKAVKVRTEGGEKRVDLVSDDYKSTVVVDRILAGVGRLPNVDGMDLESAGWPTIPRAASGSTTSCGRATRASTRPATPAWSTSTPTPPTPPRASSSRTRSSAATNG